MNSATIPTRESWLADRMTGLGASESPVVLGLSPWKSPFQLWAEKTGNAEPDSLEGNEAVEFGLRLERPIAEAFAARTGRAVDLWPAFQMVRDAATPWLTCTPDAVQEVAGKGTGLVQIKTASAYKAEDWADGPPLMYQVQCQHELAVTGYSWGTLVVLIGGQKLRYFDFERNDSFVQALLPRLAEFWRLVEARTPPAVDGSLATAQVLAKLHPEDNGDTVALPAEAAEWTERKAAAKEIIKAAEADVLDCDNRLKAALGDATFGVLPDGSRWSWKTQTRQEYVVAANTFRVLRKLK